jgi:hypothetical protein
MAAGESVVPTAAEREARWELFVRLAVSAATEDEARAVTSQALARLDPGLIWRDEPEIAPLGIRDGVWVVTLQPDLASLVAIEPDDAPTRCSFVSGAFGAGVLWTSRVSPRSKRLDWPPDIWSRRAGRDDVLLHPAVQAVLIWCGARG